MSDENFAIVSTSQMINGASESPYGLTAPDAADGDDPIAGVVAQVRFHADLAATQAERIGADRFWRVSYEQFCSDPAALAARAAERLWNVRERPELDLTIEPHRAANRRTLDAETFARIESLLSTV